MKFLDVEALSEINLALDQSEGGVDCGAYRVVGNVTSWSCKLDGSDKKLSASIESDVVASLAAAAFSPASLSSSPVGPLTEAGSRKTLIFLILTLNHLYPDYDFSNLRPQHFTREDDWAQTRARIEELLLQPARLAGGGAPGRGAALDSFWPLLETVIQPAECDVFSYTGEAEGDPFAAPHSLWSFNTFLYHRRSRRILFFTASALRPRPGGEEEEEERYEGGPAGGFFADDDMEE